VQPLKRDETINTLPKTCASAASNHAMINAHCHRELALSVWEIVSFDAANVTPAQLCGGYYSLGLHPWYLATSKVADGLQNLAAHAADKNLLAVGECGLDAAIALPLNTQIPVFEQQIELAINWRKPLMIHCVRAYHELLRIKKCHAARSCWIIHGFNGKPALAEQLLQQDCYLSIGKALLQPLSPLRSSLPQIPLSRLFLETDAADDLTIAQVYALAANILAIDSTELQRIVLDNFNRVFLHE